MIRQEKIRWEKQQLIIKQQEIARKEMERIRLEEEARIEKERQVRIAREKREWELREKERLRRIDEYNE